MNSLKSLILLTALTLSGSAFADTGIIVCEAAIADAVKAPTAQSYQAALDICQNLNAIKLSTLYQPILKNCNGGAGSGSNEIARDWVTECQFEGIRYIMNYGMTYIDDESLIK